jgi:hypothetical protein
MSVFLLLSGSDQPQQEQGGQEQEGEEDEEEEEEERIMLIAPHHKTEDRKPGHMEMKLPQGVLTKLFLYWIKTGWGALPSRVPKGKRCNNIFTSTLGNAFTDSTFCQYWMKIMKATSSSLPYFPPNLARTSFVESFTGCMGTESWEAAAFVMGNSPKQWEASYNPLSRKRAIQGAVDTHGTFSNKVMKKGEAAGQRKHQQRRQVVQQQQHDRPGPSARHGDNNSIMNEGEQEEEEESEEEGEKEEEEEDEEEPIMPYVHLPPPPMGQVRPAFVSTPKKYKQKKESSPTSSHRSSHRSIFGKQWAGW